MRGRLGVLAAMFLGPAWLAAHSAGVSGTGHDLSNEGYGTDQVCIFCHTPHRADRTYAYAPLWNHASTTAMYGLYGGGQTSAGTPVGQPGAASKACLSCHDATVAIDSYDGHVGTTTISSLSRGYANIGTSLVDDHPIGISYTQGAKFRTPTGARLFDGRVECATCHDVHSNAFRPFLRVRRAGSDLCFDCHIK